MAMRGFGGEAENGITQQIVKAKRAEGGRVLWAGKTRRTGGWKRFLFEN